MDWLEKFFKWEKKEAPEAEKSDQELDLFDEPVAKKGE